MLVANYSKSKKSNIKVYPSGANETSGIMARVEPFLTPELLISRFLKDIPGVGTYSNEELKDKIIRHPNFNELKKNLNIK